MKEFERKCVKESYSWKCKDRGSCENGRKRRETGRGSDLSPWRFERSLTLSFGRGLGLCGKATPAQKKSGPSCLVMSSCFLTGCPNAGSRGEETERAGAAVSLFGELILRSSICRSVTTAFV
ncbi:hypothetical protein AOLI_G00231680 [Acnodon oligacanthus]